MKIMSKSKIISQSSESYILREKEILSRVKNDFIINMICSFQDFSNLYLVLRLMSGGDLRYHLYYYNKPFTEEMIKFIIINISLSLNFIHQNGIIHRDIKPENFVFDKDGYLHLTDFGLAIYKEENSFNDIDIYNNNNDDELNAYGNEKFIDNEMVGTIWYIAPEIILGMDKYSKAVDFYALGVICYELIYREKPFKGALTRYQIGKEMLEDKVNYNNNKNYSDNLINFVKNLLKINPKERLGSIDGINDIKETELFKGMNWDSIQYKNIQSPFVDIIQYLRINNNNDDINELFEVEKCRSSVKLDEETKLKLSEIEASPGYIHCFQDYSFIYFENEDFNDINSLFNKDTTISSEMESGEENDEIEFNRYKSQDFSLPPIKPKLLKNVYKYKIKRYYGLLNKLKKKDDDKTHKTDKKEEKERKEKKGKKFRRHSYDSFSDKPIIINIFRRQNPNNRYGYNYNPYYPNPFLSVQNNLILPKINPFKRDYNRNNIRENHTYSRYSSSETYERLKLKEKSKDSPKKTKSKKSETIKRNDDIDKEEDKKIDSIKEKTSRHKDKKSNKKNDKGKKDDKKKEKDEEKKSSKSKGNKSNKKNEEKEEKEKGDKKNKKSKKSEKSSTSKSKKENDKEKKDKKEKRKEPEENNSSNNDEEEKEDSEEKELKTIQEKTEEIQNNSSEIKKSSEEKDEIENENNSNEEESD